jgi:hypothetical protein
MFGSAGDDLLLDLAHPGLDIHSFSLQGGIGRPARTAGPDDVEVCLQLRA